MGSYFRGIVISTFWDHKIICKYLVALLAMFHMGCSSTIGLVPITPNHKASLQAENLVLQWEPATEQAEDVYYQILIEDESHISVYERTMVRETHHVVTKHLKPGYYTWSVRPMYLRDGQWMPGPWMQREWSYFFIYFMSAGRGPYEFKIIQPKQR
jgi:hypothetical protein